MASDANLRSEFADALRSNRSRDVASIGLRLLEESPHDHQVRHRVARALFITGRPEAALHHIRQAVGDAPEEIAHRHYLAHLLISSEQFDDAAAVYDDVLARHPDHQGTAALAADLMILRARFNEAARLLTAGLERQTPAPRVAAANARLALLGHADEADAIEHLDRALAANPQTPPRLRATCLFRKGHLLDRMKRCDDAFGAFDAANHLISLPFNSDRRAQYIRGILNTWTAERITRLATALKPASTPVMIVKMPRSGSTLLEQILSSHPEIAAAGERAALFDAARDLRLGDPQTDLDALPESVRRNAAEALIRRLADAASSQRSAFITDSAPNNDVYLGVFAMLFPSAPIIWMHRHPWDTGLSCYFQDFSNALPWAFRLEHIAAYRRSHMQLRDHWTKNLSNPIHHLSYEQLVSDPETAIREVLEFLGLPWHEACLHAHANPRIAITPSNAQVNQPINTGATHRWRKYEAHLGPLRELSR